MFVLGLTGPSGAGKSTVAYIFARRGWAVVDADKIARAVVASGSGCLKGLVGAFGSGILLPDGGLDRKALARAAFSSAEDVRTLDRLTHPYIVAEIRKRLDELEEAGRTLMLLDAPALYESGADELCDGVLAVVSSKSGRIERIMARDGLTEAEAERRFGAQHDDEFYISKAGRVIINDGSVDQLQEQAERLADSFKAEALSRRRK